MPPKGSNSDCYYRGKTKEEFIQIVADSTTLTQVANACGVANYMTAKKKIKKLGLDTSHFTMKGIKRSEETKRRMSKSKMGNTNWKNSPRCQFGHEQSEETRKKIGIKAEGRMTGFKHTEEFKKQTSDRMMGNTYGKNSPGFSGHSHTEDAKDRISKSLVGQMAGEDNPGYIHGQAMVGYAGTGFYMIKYRIRERDGHTCQICFKTRIEEGKELAVHHTDYDKSNADDSNLVTLCNRCHSKTNPKPERQAYTQMFQFRALFLLIHPVSDLNSLAA